ncbi:MAG: hypothetical protein HQ559_15415, partial [Lentisphaerae bacterium]|nr:hypothetical protein [Lentisphaerota bacterium]
PAICRSGGEAGLGSGNRAARDGQFGSGGNGDLLVVNLLLSGHLPTVVSPVLLGGIGYQNYDPARPGEDWDVIYLRGNVSHRNEVYTGGHIDRLLNSLEANNLAYYAGGGLRYRHPDIFFDLLYIVSFLGFRGEDGMPQQNIISLRCGKGF